MRAIVRFWALGAMTLLGTGCSLDGLLKNDEVPAGITDPAITRTPEGAQAAYYATLAQFSRAFGMNFVVATALFTDELVGYEGIPSLPEDLRSMEENGLSSGYNVNVYNGLHRVRAQALQAIGLLERYRSGEPDMRGHIYAIEGYAEVFLAELFCSGIPLSTLDFDGDYTYRPGSPTDSVLTHAAALFDTALALAGGDARVEYLARVGQARALLGLDEYEAAAAVVAAVPNDYSYAVSFAPTNELASFARVQGAWKFTVVDREGGNGLDWSASGDPRTQVTYLGTPEAPRNFPTYHPNKYATDGSSPIVLASGVEARLIEAEALLQANPDDGQWLAKLNALRTTCTDPASCPTPAPAGSGGVAGLPLLADPIDPAARVDLLFRERAFWLFLTGHRHGDLRRLIRQYGRLQEQVFPIGSHVFGDRYGSDVTAPIPSAERRLNPYFTGCVSRGA